MRKGLCVGLFVALVFSAQLLDAQDSSDSSGTSDTSDTSSADATATSPASPDSVSVTDATDTATTAFSAVDFATQQAIDAVTTPWVGVPAPAPASNLVVGPGGNSVPGGAGEPGTSLPGSPTQPSEPVAPITGFPPARRAEIHAVIVSNLSDPSQVLFRERQL